MNREPHPCSECRIDEEEAGVHHTVCEGFPDCTISVCDSCRQNLIMQGKWIVCEPHEEWPNFDKCKTCYDIEGNHHWSNNGPWFDERKRNRLKEMHDDGYFDDWAPCIPTKQEEESE